MPEEEVQFTRIQPQGIVAYGLGPAIEDMGNWQNPEAVTSKRQANFAGVIFPISANYSASIRPVMASNGVTVKYHELQLSVEWIEYKRTATEGTAEDVHFYNAETQFDYERRLAILQTALRTPGHTLTIVGIGLSRPLIVVGREATNSENNDGHHSIDGGPHPGPLQWTPLGPNNACRIAWSVTARFNANAYGSGSDLLDVSFQMSWALDQSGMTSRNISGTIEERSRVRVDRPNTPARIVSGIAGGAAPIDTDFTRSADFRRDYLIVGCPNNFTRTQNYSLSADRKTLQFTIHDTEIPSDNPYPDHIVSCSANHTISASLADGGFQRWHSEISGSFTVKPRYDKSWGWIAFLHILKSRIGRDKNGNEVTIASGNSSAILITSIRMSDEIFGRGCNFTVSYVLTTSLATIIKSSGIFSRLPSDKFKWSTWKTSMEICHSTRGFAGEYYSPSAEVILNLEDTGNTDRRDEVLNIAASDPIPDEPLSPVVNALSIAPAAENSWVGFTNAFEIMSTSNTVRHAGLGKTDVTAYNSSGLLAASNDRTKTADQVLPKSSDAPGLANNYTQVRGSSKVLLRMSGMASRAGHPITHPVLHTIANVQPIVISQNVKQTQAASLSAPLYVCRWDIVYEFSGLPDGAQVTQANLFAATKNPLDYTV